MLKLQISVFRVYKPLDEYTESNISVPCIIGCWYF